MKKILVISKWEINRLLTRFGGKSGLIILAVVVVAVVVSFLVYHSGAIGGKELYSVGVSPNAPHLYDERFKVIEADFYSGQEILETYRIDIYLDESRVYHRNDARSIFVKDTLLQYLAEQEILQTAEKYGIDRTFPLRIQIIPLDRGSSLPGSDEGDAILSLSDADDSGAISEEDRESPAFIEEFTGVSDTSIAIERQLNAFEEGGFAQLKETLLTERDIIIPSLTPPVLPMAQVILVFTFVLPVLLVAVFFAGSFAEERISRRLVVLLSTPVSPLQIILGKLLPYMVYSWIAIAILATIVGADILLNLAIFTPVILLIFSAYMVVALMYRSFKELTLFSVLVISAVMVYLVVPALLTGVSNLSYISPLTLAVAAYRGETFSFSQYCLSSVPLYLIFSQTLYIGTCVFNEEYLFSYKSLHLKILDALKMAVHRSHLAISAFLSNFFLMPGIFVVQLVVILFVQNIPAPVSLWILIILSAALEELAKSAVLYVVIKDNLTTTQTGLLRLSVLSGAGFFIGEKLLLFLALSVLSESSFITAAFSGGLWILPLVLHIVSTSIVGFLIHRLGIRYYLLAVVSGTVIHVLYNLFLTGVLP